MNFDRDYLDQEFQGQQPFVQRRLRRDATLRDLGVDPEAFKVWQRDAEVGNETDTDEYRETQPAKGLGMIADFLMDRRAGEEATTEVIRLTLKWLGVVSDANTNRESWDKKIGWWAYGGGEELAPILNICFDFVWEEGGYSLYTSLDQLPGEEDVEYYKETMGR